MGAYDDLIPKGSGNNPYADLIPKKDAPVVPETAAQSAFPMAGRIEEARTRDTPISRTARVPEKAKTSEEAAAAVERLRLDDGALAALIRPDAPESVTGDEINVKRNEDWLTAGKYIGNRKIIAGLKPTLTPTPLRTEAAVDATRSAPATAQAAQAIPTPVLTPKPLATAAPADASTAPTGAPETDPVIAKEAKMQERAQTLAEALPSFAKGTIKGATAGLVDPTTGAEGAPGALGQIAGNLAGGAAAAAAGVVGAPAFLMTQFLSDLEERGMDPAKLADPEILALAATSGLFGGLTPVAFGKKALTRALTGAALGAAQNVAEEDVIAKITDTEADRMRAAILGGAFGAGFGALFRESPKVREAVEAKLPEADVKAMDEVLAEAAPESPAAAEITPEVKPEIGAETPVVEKPITVAEEVSPAGAKVPEQSAATEVPELQVPENGAQVPELGAKLGEQVPEQVPAPDAEAVEAQRLWREKKTESPYFKKWFGESKVVDDEGKPLVVYHGSATDIEAFKAGGDGKNGVGEVDGKFGVYFSNDPNTASRYAKDVSVDKSFAYDKDGNYTFPDDAAVDAARADAKGASVYPSYIKMDNPLVFDVRAWEDSPAGAGQDFKPGIKGKEILRSAKKQGYDGVIFKNVQDEYTHGLLDETAHAEGKSKAQDYYVVFDPTQIKSATGNTGKFSPNDPSITDSHPGKPFGSTPEGIVRAPEPDENYTSARKSWTTAQREKLGLSELPSPERKSWEKALDEAKEKNLDAEADALAKVIIEKPRALNDVETAGMVIRMESLVQQHDSAYENFAKLTEPDEINAQARQIEEIEKQIDLVTRAVQESGTEKGRNLAAQKLTINKNYDLAHVINRAKAKKGAPLEPAERAKFEDLDAKLKDTEKQLVDAQSRIRDLRAREAIKERSTSSKRKPEEVKVTLADLTEKTRRLLRAGCLTS